MAGWHLARDQCAWGVGASESVQGPAGSVLRHLRRRNLVRLWAIAVYPTRLGCTSPKPSWTWAPPSARMRAARKTKEEQAGSVDGTLTTSDVREAHTDAGTSASCSVPGQWPRAANERYAARIFSFPSRMVAIRRKGGVESCDGAGCPGLVHRLAGLGPSHEFLV